MENHTTADLLKVLFVYILNKSKDKFIQPYSHKLGSLLVIFLWFGEFYKEYTKPKVVILLPPT